MYDEGRRVFWGRNRALNSHIKLNVDGNKDNSNEVKARAKELWQTKKHQLLNCPAAIEQPASDFVRP